MEHLKHYFKKTGDRDTCLICGMTRENYYGVIFYTRQGIEYGNYEMKCINLEILNKVFENLEF